MKLKELAYIVHRTLDEHQDLWGEQVVETQYLFTQKDAEKYFAFCGELDETEIERLGETFWSMDIDARDFAEVARAVALCIEARCANNDDRKEKKEWLDGIKQSVLDNVIVKLNRRKQDRKNKDCNWKIGEFNKFEFIQNYGHCYDSDEEANTDANDKASTCPLLMGIINSGWLNLAAAEDKMTGKIHVSKKKEDYPFNAMDFLGRVQVAFEDIIEKKKYKEIRTSIRNEFLIWKLMNDGRGAFTLPYSGCVHLDADIHEFRDCLEDFLFDATKFPQTVFDFKTLHKKFMAIVNQYVLMYDTIDETMEDIVKALVMDTMENINTLADVEVKIFKEQMQRDPNTKRFIKPRFNTDYLIYTMTLDVLMNYLENKFRSVMRLDYYSANTNNISPFNKWQKEYKYPLDGMLKRQYTHTGRS